MSILSQPDAKAESSSLLPMASGRMHGHLKASIGIPFMANALAGAPLRGLRGGGGARGEPLPKRTDGPQVWHQKTNGK